MKRINRKRVSTKIRVQKIIKTSQKSKSYKMIKNPKGRVHAKMRKK